LGAPVQASYGSSTRPDCAGRLAVVEMASASGLEKVPLDLRNPLHTTTEGTGQLMQHAFDEGHSHIIVGMVRVVCVSCVVCRACVCRVSCCAVCA
jgi:glycerate kinase